VIEKFLATIWRPVGFGEIRAIDHRAAEGKVKQRFFNLSENGVTIAVDHVRALAEGGGIDVYFGVVPRMRAAGKKTDVMPFTDVLWADLDSKASSKSSVWGHLQSFAPAPSIVVDSGNGYHAYWLLRELVEGEEAELAMRTLARRIGGDHTHDVSRVLRVPGTTNYKNTEDLLAVRILQFNTRRYRWSDFEADAKREERMVRKYDVPIGRERGEAGTPGWLEELIRDGAPQGQRSEAAFKVCVWLARFGYSDGEIFSEFQNNPGGIGAKYHERRDGDRWLQVTINSARQRA
jgi:hypothetical protein